MSKIVNYSHALSLKQIDYVINCVPRDLLKNEDVKICVTSKIYNDVKSYLVDEKYKGFLIYTFGDVPKNGIYASASKYHK